MATNKGENLRLIDWQELGLELRRHNFLPYAVARSLNLPPSTVMSWFNHGVEPGYSNGVRCIRFYIITTGKRPPIRDVFETMTATVISDLAQQ